MKASLSWLSDYVSIEAEPSDLADALTMVGLEVEALTDRYSYLESVFVGRIVDIGPHPNADTLLLCDVNMGDRNVSVVCGAPNVKKGMTAPIALPGTVFPDGSVLKKDSIRGVLSEAMLCSEAELGLGSDKSGIMVLNGELSPGECLVKALALSDSVFEIGLTPNRPDCLSMIGIAREVAAIQNTGLIYPDAGIFGTENRISDLTSVSIEAPDHCPRYAARLIEAISISDSPFWLQDRLMSVGLRPINNIVDITNFVMMETGQPLHAFDFDRLAEHRIVVRTANEGEVFVTLDEKERRLSPEMLMICDGRGPVAIGGVMGGLNSEIEDATERVLIESAYFSPVSIRKTSKQLGLSTEASHRFERGVDPKGTVNALNRAAGLMLNIGGGVLIEGVVDAHPRPVNNKPVTLSVNDTNRLLGTSLNRNDIETLLTSIGFGTSGVNRGDGPGHDSDNLVVTAPSFRVDISRPEDLMEEVARLSGYNRIPVTFPLIPAGDRRPMRHLELRHQIRGLMTGLGFTEAINYSFVNKLSCDWLEMKPDDPRRRMVEILNPITEDQTVMRTSLVPGLLGTMQRNIAQQIRTLRLFEIGKVFIGRDKESLPDEKEMLAGLWTGSRFDASWHFRETECDFYDLKGVLEGLFAGLGVADAGFTGMPAKACCTTRPGLTAQIAAGGRLLGSIGELNRNVLKHLGLKQTAFLFELDLETLSSCIPDALSSVPIPKFPSIVRDLSIIVGRDVESMRILENVKHMGEELIEDIHLFDVFEGDPVPPGRKSLSLRITYRSLEETLQDETATRIHKAVAERLMKAFDADLPAVDSH
jgi:phenylalanyl-tRNA synthetase beta chain